MRAGPRGAELLVVGDHSLSAQELLDLLRERLDSALRRLAPSTKRGYGGTFKVFAHWFAGWLPSKAHEVVGQVLGSGLIGADWLGIFVALLKAGPLVASTVVETYATEGCDGRAPATVNSRLNALRWAFRLARDNGLVHWDLRVRGPRVRSYRDLRGPSLEEIIRMRLTAEKIGGLLGERDAIMLALVGPPMALRRAEACSLRVGDFDRAGSTLLVVGKGETEPQPISVPVPLADRIAAYLTHRGDLGGGAPLLASHDRAGKGSGGLTPNGLYRRIGWLARSAGIGRPVRPHGLRHAAITMALDALNGDVRRVRAFARHAKAETTLIYDDRRRDVAGEVSSLLAQLVGLTPLQPSAATDGDDHENAQYRALTEPTAGADRAARADAGSVGVEIEPAVVNKERQR